MFHLSPLFPYAEDVVDDIGLDIWEASRVLCNFMLQNIAVRHLITAAPGILELGAGQIAIVSLIQPFWWHSTLIVSQFGVTVSPVSVRVSYE